MYCVGTGAGVDVSAGIQKIAKQAVADGKAHDLTVGFGRGDTGLTIHCNDYPIKIAGQTLQKHCHARKYTNRACPNLVRRLHTARRSDVEIRDQSGFWVGAE